MIEPSSDKETNRDSLSIWTKRKVFVYLIATLLLFLFAITFMVASLKHVGANFSDAIIVATANPFTGLFIGLLITALLQSSSTTTSLVVALVASHSVGISAAVPLIMGANIGTTITSTIVAFAFINKKKEYKRALAAGTYHHFFNFLTALILFPLEYLHRSLSNLAGSMASWFVHGEAPVVEHVTDDNGTMDTLVISILTQWNYPVILALISLVIVLVSVLMFRRISSTILQAGKPERVSRFFFESRLKSFMWGTLITSAIRSSTITTSMVVPLVAKKITSLEKAAPFILGANIGTTITAFIAVTMNANSHQALTIALAHFLFNAFGVIIFLFIPLVREIPVLLAKRLGKMALRFRLIGLVYLLLMFFVIPFLLIYLNS